MIEKFCAFSLLVVSIYYILLHESLILLIAVTVIGSLYICLKPVFVSLFEESVLSNKSIEVPSHAKHDERRFNTYPCPVFNTWYHFCDSDELKDGKVIEFRALGRVFVLWRNDEGQPVCQDAFCIHLGANLGKGGKVVDNCLECPFHKWKFASDGTVKEVPYLKNPSMCQTGKKLKTYHCQDWCGLVMVYFHADDKEPEYQLPAFVECDMKRDGWTPHTKWNIGYVRFTAIDFADQAGDHSHFQTLHSDFMIPWTRVPLPKWFLRLCPVGISHTCTTYRGDDKEWADYVANSDWGTVDRYLLFFTDLAGLTWQGETMKPTLAATREMYVGPCLINFHIPFTIGTFKVFVSIVPVDGGSIMRVRTWVDGRTSRNFFIKTLAYWLTGVSASQLDADVEILENRIRLCKPMIQPFDGPYNRVNAWMKLFHSEGSERARYCNAYKNDW